MYPINYSSSSSYYLYYVRHQGLCVTHLFPTFIFFFLAWKRILYCLVHWRNLNKTNDVFYILFGFSHIGTSTDPQYTWNGGKIHRCVFFFYYFLLHSSQCRIAHNLMSFVHICTYITNHTKEKRDKRNHNFHRFEVHALVNSLDA